MPTVAAVLKQEMQRIARREARARTRRLDETIAELRKRVRSQQREIERLRSAVNKRATTGAHARPSGAALATAEWERDTVRRTRDALGMTQKELAQLLGVSPITISFWETGRTTPRAKQRVKILASAAMSPRSASRAVGGVSGRARASKRGGAAGERSTRKAAGGKSKARRKVAKRRKGPARRKAAREAA